MAVLTTTSKSKFSLAFAAGIGIIWSIVALYAAVTHDYTALGIVSPVMMLAAGAILGVTIQKNGGK